MDADRAERARHWWAQSISEQIKHFSVSAPWRPRASVRLFGETPFSPSSTFCSLAVHSTFIISITSLVTHQSYTPTLATIRANGHSLSPLISSAPELRTPFSSQHEVRPCRHCPSVAPQAIVRHNEGLRPRQYSPRICPSFYHGVCVMVVTVRRKCFGGETER